MRAIVLSAGQGRRLLPLTENDPKCMLTVDGEVPVLEFQLRTLASCGIARATVLVGFGADRVESFVRRTRVRGMAVDTLYNPFYAISDNLVTCWLARTAMSEDFVLLNGDTLFEEAVLHQVMRGSSAPVSVTVDRKPDYDDDDMKVSLDAKGRLRAIGKRLPPETVNGESIGLLAFRDVGVKWFREALETAIRRPDALTCWYLSVLNEMAQRLPVASASIHGLWWQEIDSAEDLERARRALRDGSRSRADRLASAAAGFDSV